MPPASELQFCWRAEGYPLRYALGCKWRLVPPFWSWVIDANAGATMKFQVIYGVGARHRVRHHRIQSAQQAYDTRTVPVRRIAPLPVHYFVTYER